MTRFISAASYIRSTLVPRGSCTDREKNRFSARAKRYANVGSKVGGVAARMAGQRLLGSAGDRAANALRWPPRSAGSKARS